MHSNEYEEAFGRFLERAEYDEAEDALVFAGAGGVSGRVAGCGRRGKHCCADV